MPLEILGNTLSPKIIDNLLGGGKIAIRFTSESKTGYAKRIERALNSRFRVEDSTPDYGGNRFAYEGKVLRRKSHDCGNSDCGGLGETYYVIKKELEEIAKSI